MKYIDYDGYVGILYAFGEGVKYATRKFGDETREMLVARMFYPELVKAIFELDMELANKILRERFAYVKISAYDLQVDWVLEGSKISVIFEDNREKVVVINDTYTV